MYWCRLGYILGPRVHWANIHAWEIRARSTLSCYSQHGSLRCWMPVFVDSSPPRHIHLNAIAHHLISHIPICRLPCCVQSSTKFWASAKPIRTPAPALHARSTGGLPPPPFELQNTSFAIAMSSQVWPFIIFPVGSSQAQLPVFYLCRVPSSTPTPCSSLIPTIFSWTRTQAPP